MYLFPTNSFQNDAWTLHNQVNTSQYYSEGTATFHGMTFKQSALHLNDRQFNFQVICLQIDPITDPILECTDSHVYGRKTKITAIIIGRGDAKLKSIFNQRITAVSLQTKKFYKKYLFEYTGNVTSQGWLTVLTHTYWSSVSSSPG